MTIPRSLGTPTGPRRALPDFTRGAATVERMLRALDGGAGADAARRADGSAAGVRSASAAASAAGGRTRVRVLEPDHRLGRSTACAIVSAAGLGSAPLPIIGAVLLLMRVPSGHSPDLVTLAVVAALVIVDLVLVLTGLRFGYVGLAIARSRVEIAARTIRVRGAVREREIDWADVVGVEARVVHPVHGLTAALRLADGSRALLPILDRPFWEHSRPSGPQIRRLRRELRRRRPRG
ncbi:PH domain-containing protein [Brachybacterium sp. DNPG3]